MGKSNVTFREIPASLLVPNMQENWPNLTSDTARNVERKKVGGRTCLKYINYLWCDRRERERKKEVDTLVLIIPRIPF